MDFPEDRPQTTYRPAGRKAGTGLPPAVAVYRALPVEGAGRVQQLAAPAADTVLPLVETAAGTVPQLAAVAKRARLLGVADTVLQPAADCRVQQLAAPADKVRVTAVAKRAPLLGPAAGTVPVQEARRRAGTPLPVANSARKGWEKAAATDLPPAFCRLLGGAH